MRSQPKPRVFRHRRRRSQARRRHPYLRRGPRQPDGAGLANLANPNGGGRREHRNVSHDDTETSPSAPAEAPAAPEPVASAPVVAAAPAEPKPRETCPTCDQVIPNDDDDGTPVDPNTSAPGYTVEIAMDTMDLCAIAKLYLRSPNRLLNSKLFYGDLGNLCRIANACRADLDHRLCDDFGNRSLRSTKQSDRSVYWYARSRRSASSGSRGLSSLITRTIAPLRLDPEASQSFDLRQSLKN